MGKSEAAVTLVMQAALALVKAVNLCHLAAHKLLTERMRELQLMFYRLNVLIFVFLFSLRALPSLDSDSCSKCGCSLCHPSDDSTAFDLPIFLSHSY